MVVGNEGGKKGRFKTRRQQPGLQNPPMAAVHPSSVPRWPTGMAPLPYCLCTGRMPSARGK